MVFNKAKRCFSKIREYVFLKKTNKTKRDNNFPNCMAMISNIRDDDFQKCKMMIFEISETILFNKCKAMILKKSGR
jgi:hypothetical protein